MTNLTDLAPLGAACLLLAFVADLRWRGYCRPEDSYEDGDDDRANRWP